ncbi:hypothetical protein [Nocardioides sp.]|uniref:hypothetical protein n=1 Tax=Nocardioides sp. TaxID=35761 RepID=UPI003518D6C9
MSDTFIEAPAEPADNKLQIVAALLLGLAATFTALSAYNAALKDGEALQGYTNSTRTLNDANAFYAQGNTTAAQDQQLFVAYATATQEGNADLSEYLTTLMSENLQAAVDWWQNSDEAITPFDTDAEDNPYAIEDFATAAGLEEDAKKFYADGAAADDNGDKYELSTVLMALTLFFGGISTLFSRRKVAVSLLALGTVTLVLGGIQFASGVADFKFLPL